MNLSFGKAFLILTMFFILIMTMNALNYQARTNCLHIQVFATVTCMQQPFFFHLYLFGQLFVFSFLFEFYMYLLKILAQKFILVLYFFISEFLHLFKVCVPFISSREELLSLKEEIRIIPEQNSSDSFMCLHYSLFFVKFTTPYTMPAVVSLGKNSFLVFSSDMFYFVGVYLLDKNVLLYFCKIVVL